MSLRRPSSHLLHLFPPTTTFISSKIRLDSQTNDPNIYTQIGNQNHTAHLFPNFPNFRFQSKSNKMTKNKHSTPNTTPPPRPFPQQQPPRTYAQAATPPPNPSPPPAAPYHQSTWRFYMDQNPWTQQNATDTPAAAVVPNTQTELPLPPKPSHPAWKNRCYM